MPYTLHYTMPELVIDYSTMDYLPEEGQPENEFTYTFIANNEEEALEIAKSYLDNLAKYAGICEIICIN